MLAQADHPDSCLHRLQPLDPREVTQAVAVDLYADFVENRAPDYARFPPY